MKKVKKKIFTLTEKRNKMGELLGDLGDTHQATARRDEVPIETKDDGFDTDVEGVKAAALYGPHKLPVFDVEPDEFYQNSEYGRKRMRFKTPAVQQYMRGSKYAKPFYIRTSRDGKQYIKRVK